MSASCSKSLALLVVLLAVLSGCQAFAPTRSFTSTRHYQQQTTPTTTPKAATLRQRPVTSLTTNGIELANLFYDSTSTAFDCWEWTAGLGAPAALVAGAVLVTLSESRQDLTPRKKDRNWVRVVKQLTRFLLLSSFALEVVSIFVSTVTGSVLLSHGEVATAAKAIGYTSPLGLLYHHHEFEYLTIQMGFLQGLIHWLGAVGLELMVPKQGETVSSKRMNGFMASCLVTLIFWILAFYNHHLTFYSDYMHMMLRYMDLFTARYFGTFRPMSLLYTPSAIFSAVMGWRAFTTKPDLDGDEEEGENQKIRL